MAASRSPSKVLDVLSLPILAFFMCCLCFWFVMHLLLCLVSEKLFWGTKTFWSVMISLSSCAKLLLFLSSGFVKFFSVNYLHVCVAVFKKLSAIFVRVFT
jgi:hypothetical protein